jgi:hypothetical protein
MLAWVAQLLATYGYGAVALVVMGESLGLPRPGETRLLAQLRAAGETIADEDVARISPAAFALVIPNGTYFVRPTPLERDEDSAESLGRLDEGMELDA